MTEESRLEALYRYHILDTDNEKAFDEIVELASFICGTPISLISLIDKDRQWFKANKGLTDTTETTRDVAFCHYAIKDSKVMVVNNATEDKRFNQNPLVLGDPNIKFYAGAPLTTSDGYNLGSLCVIDRVPRELNDDQIRALEILSNRVMSEMELRLQLEKAQEQKIILENINNFKDNLLSILAHDLRAPLNSIESSLDLFNRGMLSRDEFDNLAKMIHGEAKSTNELLNNLLNWARNKLDNLEKEDSIFKADTIIAPTYDLFQPVAHKKGVKLFYEAQPGVICGDKELIKMALRNLVNNAIKFCGKGDSVTISTRTENNNAIISVSDTGVGMNEDKLASLLSGTNHSSQPGTSKETGVGLGFILIRDSVISSGGQLSAKSSPGKGSTFEITLPANCD